MNYTKILNRAFHGIVVLIVAAFFTIAVILVFRTFEKNIISDIFRY
jgi:hypothetical protein